MANRMARRRQLAPLSRFLAAETVSSNLYATDKKTGERIGVRGNAVKDFELATTWQYDAAEVPDFGNAATRRPNSGESGYGNL